MIIRPFEPPDEAAVIELWRRCNLIRPQSDPHKDITRKMRVQPHMFLVAVVEGALVGSVMAGYEGHRGWLNYVGVAPEHRKRGIGRALIDEAERLLREAGCPKINLQVFSGNHAAMHFYRSIGFVFDDSVSSMGKRLQRD